MAWKIEYLQDAERDFELIFDHLFDAYRAFGDGPDEAIERVRRRISGLREDVRRLSTSPLIGTVRSDIYPGLRFVRRSDAAIWFMADEAQSTVLIVAIFFGSQDHIRHMMARLLRSD